MEINENSGGPISLEEAQVYVKEFRKQFPEEVKAFFMGRVNFNALLDQKDCMGIRIYNGYDTVEKRMNVVLVGVNSAGSDMTDGVIMDRAWPCPKYCDINSELMS